MITKNAHRNERESMNGDEWMKREWKVVISIEKVHTQRKQTNKTKPPSAIYIETFKLDEEFHHRNHLKNSKIHGEFENATPQLLHTHTHQRSVHLCVCVSNTLSKQKTENLHNK